MQISETGGRAVATDIRAAFGSVDSALIDAARLATTVMETNAVSDIPPAHLQGALDSMAASFSKLVEGRRDMVQVHRKLTVLKGGSNISETGLGCWEILIRGEAPATYAVPASV